MAKQMKAREEKELERQRVKEARMKRLHEDMFALSISKSYRIRKYRNRAPKNCKKNKNA